jgi:hypothetical protein
MTFVHFTTRPFSLVSLSPSTALRINSAKNLTVKPFAALRVTPLVCQSRVVCSRIRTQVLDFTMGGDACVMTG